MFSNLFLVHASQVLRALAIRVLPGFILVVFGTLRPHIGDDFDI